MFGSKAFGDPFGDSSPPPPARPAVATAIAKVTEQIQRTCIEIGRDPSSVKLVAVSKTRDVEEIRLALDAGAEDLGENYIQEAREKARKLPGARWHMVGNLQKNKVNLAVDLFEVIHSLDNVSLIRRIEKRCLARHRRLTGLLQVNLSKEKTKHGLTEEKLFQLVEELNDDPPEHLRISGLMTIPPPVESPEDNRIHFRRLKELLDEIVARKYSYWSGYELSMGMSDDYLVAIEEGATLIRVGRGIFGERS